MTNRRDSYSAGRSYQRDTQSSDYGYDAPSYDNGYEEDYREPQQTTSTYGAASKIVNHPAVGARHRTMIYQLSNYEDSKDVIDDLLEGHSVLINLESLALEEAQRIIDTLIGACYAINATIKKAAAQTYLLAPETVEVAGTYADDNRGGTIFEDGRN
ncbi:MAG: cell division protein SepF [Candidatus Spyradocola sp.]